MSELVRRVATALCDRRGGECSCVSDIEQAKAAIAALRNADLSPFIDGINVQMRDLGNEFSLSALWNAVIDEALK